MSDLPLIQSFVAVLNDAPYTLGVTGDPIVDVPYKSQLMFGIVPLTGNSFYGVPRGQYPFIPSFIRNTSDSIATYDSATQIITLKPTSCFRGYYNKTGQYVCMNPAPSDYNQRNNTGVFPYFYGYGCVDYTSYVLDSSGNHWNNARGLVDGITGQGSLPFLFNEQTSPDYQLNANAIYIDGVGFYGTSSAPASGAFSDLVIVGPDGHPLTITKACAGMVNYNNCVVVDGGYYDFTDFWLYQWFPNIGIVSSNVGVPTIGGVAINTNSVNECQGHYLTNNPNNANEIWVIDGKLRGYYSILVSPSNALVGAGLPLKRNSFTMDPEGRVYVGYGDNTTRAYGIVGTRMYFGISPPVFKPRIRYSKNSPCNNGTPFGHLGLHGGI